MVPKVFREGTVPNTVKDSLFLENASSTNRGNVHLPMNGKLGNLILDKIKINNLIYGQINYILS
jgi:hypothetical protein